MPHTPLLTNFAAASNSNVMHTLGIDWKLLVFQILAFGILVWALAKYVFPSLIKVIDERQRTIEDSIEAAKEAEKHAEKAQAEVEKLLKEARLEASDIVTTAKDEAADIAAKAEEKSRTSAERIVADAHSAIDKEIIAAKKALHNETIELVAVATEKVIGKKVDAAADKALIADSLKTVEGSK